MNPSRLVIRMGKRVLAVALSLALLGPVAPVAPQEARAVDSGMVNALSMATMAFAITNTASSAGDCACMVTGSSCANYPWATCGMIALTVATLVASLLQKDKNADSAEHFDPNAGDFKSDAGGGGGGGSTGAVGGLVAGLTSGGAGPGGTLPPGAGGVLPLDWADFCAKSSEFCNDCAKSGDFANCKPEMILPDNFPFEAASQMPELAEAMAALREGMDFVNGNSDPNAALASGGESGFGGEEGGGGSSDPLVIKKAKGLGKESGDGLGNASIWGMDMVDEKTGAKLTLWQRATRRYYGAPELKRLNYLARAEYVRNRAIQHAKANLKNPAPAKLAQHPAAQLLSNADKSATVVTPKAVERAPASSTSEPTNNGAKTGKY